MAKNNKKNHERVADVQGRLRTSDIPKGSWRDEQDNDKIAEEILKNAQVKEYSKDSGEGEQPKPCFSEDLISQYEFFRDNIHNPKRIFYPCCGLDASPLKGFPNSEVVLMDKVRGLEGINGQEGKNQIIQRDVLTYQPKKPFDLVIILNPALSSSDLTKHLIRGGYVLANNWHNNTSQLLEDSEFEGIGTIDRNKQGIYLARNFDKLEPEQWDTYLYVFQKTKGEKA